MATTSRIRPTSWQLSCAGLRHRGTTSTYPWLLTHAPDRDRHLATAEPGVAPRPTTAGGGWGRPVRPPGPSGLIDLREDPTAGAVGFAPAELPPHVEDRPFRPVAPPPAPPPPRTSKEALGRRSGTWFSDPTGWSPAGWSPARRRMLIELLVALVVILVVAATVGRSSAPPSRSEAAWVAGARAALDRLAVDLSPPRPGSSGTPRPDPAFLGRLSSDVERVRALGRPPATAAALAWDQMMQDVSFFLSVAPNSAAPPWDALGGAGLELTVLLGG
ncbi:MAG: hypothetical protein KGQ66_04890 [Acidobacteriota bacterium]|nr:hypothetical protein [Acidobacteriota bacterium]